MGDDDFTISESLNPVSQFAIENGLQKEAEYMKVHSVRIYGFLYLCVHPQKVSCTVSVTDCMYVYIHISIFSACTFLLDCLEFEKCDGKEPGEDL